MHRLAERVRQYSAHELIPLGVTAGLALLLLLILGRGLDNPLVSDDWTLLNAVDAASHPLDLVRVITQTWGWWYLRPTEWLITYLLYQIAGVEPFWYHGTSLGLHVVNALLVGILAHQSIRSPATGRRRSIWVAIAVGVFFASSWRHHESVFWYSSINELLAAFFRLLVVLLLLGWSRDREKCRWVYWGAVVCFALALLSKESAIVSVIEGMAVPAFVMWTSKKRLPGKVLFVSWLPFLLIAAGWALYYQLTRSHLVRAAGPGILAQPVYHLALRFIQHLNANLTAAAIINHSTPVLVIETALLSCLARVAFWRKRYEWVFLLCWTLVSVAPYVVLVPEIRFDVASRFLYSSSIPASLWVIDSVLWLVEEIRASLGIRWAQSAAVLGGLVCAFYVGRNLVKLVAFEAEWQAAGDIAVGIVQGIIERYPEPHPGQTWCFESVPDSYRDKYVFRNGIEAALYLAYGRRDLRIERLDRGGAPARTECDCIFTTQGYEIASQCTR